MLNIVDIAAENKVRELYLASSEVYQTLISFLLKRKKLENS